MTMIIVIKREIKDLSIICIQVDIYIYIKAMHITCEVDVPTDPVNSDPLGKSQVRTQQGLGSLKIGYFVFDANVEYHILCVFFTNLNIGTFPSIPALRISLLVVSDQ